MHQETLTYQGDGLQWLNEQGAAILSHENTHKHLLAAQRVKDWEYNFPSPPLPAVPTEIFSSEKAVGLNRSTLRLKHYGPAHSVEHSLTYRAMKI